MQMFFDGHYPAMPDYWIAAKEQPRHVPKYSAVYIVVDHQGLVQYVGQTTNMRQRYSDHQSWMKPKDKIGWIKCPDEELLFMESWFIATLRPWRNANQSRRAVKAISRKSAKVSVVASNIWKPGSFAEVNDLNAIPKSKWCGRIDDVNGTSVRINGKWRSKNRVTVVLP